MKIHSYGVKMTVEDGIAVGALLAVGVDELEGYRETQGELFVAPLSEVKQHALLAIQEVVRV